jgi:hypothetical protein
MDQAIERLVMAFGIDHVVVDRGRPTDPAASLYCSTTAITRGKPAMTIESGSLGVSEYESVERIVNGIPGVLRELRMKDGGREPLLEAVYLGPTAVVTSPETGILYSQVECGQTVPKGALLAHIIDFFGKTIAEVRSPLDGLVLYIVAIPPTAKGQPVACVGSPRSSPCAIA